VFPKITGQLKSPFHQPAYNSKGITGSRRRLGSADPGDYRNCPFLKAMCRDPADCMPIRSLRYFLAKRILTEVFAELNPEEPKT
jgi:hypothetical protein